MNEYLEQNTQEWLDWRKDKIGASDAPVIMEVSPFKTPKELWLSKRGELEETDTPWMKRGRDMESTALAAFEKEMDYVMFPLVLKHKSREWMVASMDGVTMERDAGVEIKCAGKVDHAIAKQGKVPDKYYPQLQHQIEVAELDSIFYWSFDGEEGVVIRVERDDSYIKNMVEKEEEFYKLLIEGIPPALTDRDYRQKEDDLDWMDAEKKWIEDYNALQKAKKYEATARKDLINLSKGKSSIGRYAKLTKYIEKGRVNYSDIPELFGIDLDGYRGEEKEKWRFSLKTA